MKKIFFIIATGYFLVLISALLSCDNLMDDCGPFPDKFKVTSLKWNNVKISSSERINQDFSIQFDSVKYNEYGIQIIPITTTYFSEMRKNTSIHFIQSAYACSPITPTTDEKIDSILIFTDKDFDLNHTAGKELSELFSVIVSDNNNTLYQEKYDLNQYVVLNPGVPEEMVIFLKSPPIVSAFFEFTVKYYQKGIDEDYFEFKTNKIFIEK